MFGCSPDQQREKQAAPGTPTHPVSIAPSENLSSIETDVARADGVRVRARCETCHAQVDVGAPAQAVSELQNFHRGLTFSHGTLPCASCHTPGAPLSLHLATGKDLPITDAIELCSQCHGPQRRSYDNGMHGGMTGYWDLSRGPRLKNQCVHCHDPHTPQIAQVLPVLPPRDRGLVARPHAEGKAHP